MLYNVFYKSMPPRGGAGGCKVKIRERFIFKGDVQGVGFRFRAYHAANVLGLTGFVRNEYDGSVLLEAQGDRAGIDELIRTLSGGLYIHIDDVTSCVLPVDDGERAFTISD
jgi:acylphosphatase